VNDDQLKSLLKQLDEPVQDGGFTANVLQALPRTRRPRYRAVLLGIAYFLGCAMVATWFPLERLSVLAAGALATPWLVPMYLLGLSALSWLLAKSLVAR
jgi:hypothetical protein